MPPLAETATAPRKGAVERGPARARAVVVVVAITASLLLSAAVSVGVGSTGIDPVGAVRALLSPDESTLRALILDTRVPRTMLAALIGCALAVAGLLAQTATRNPLASAQTFGINAGAAAGIVISALVAPAWVARDAPLGFTGAALAGAAVVGVVMWALSTSGAVSVVGLALAGTTIQIVLTSIVQAVLILQSTTQDLVFWMAGSVTGAQWSDVLLLLPAVVLGLAVSVLGARPFAALALDAETAASLGHRPRAGGGIAMAVVVVLAGTSVAAAGPIGFLGVVVPHLARFIVGAGFGAALATCAVLGPLVLVGADLLGRLLAFPSETPTGIVTAVLGAPVFLVLVIRARRA